MQTLRLSVTATYSPGRTLQAPRHLEFRFGDPQDEMWRDFWGKSFKNLH